MIGPARARQSVDEAGAQWNAETTDQRCFPILINGEEFAAGVEIRGPLAIDPVGARLFGGAYNNFTTTWDTVVGWTVEPHWRRGVPAENFAKVEH